MQGGTSDRRASTRAFSRTPVKRTQPVAQRAPGLATVLRRAEFAPDISRLQRAVGNQAVAGALQGTTVRREVDTSSSPSLPKYDDGEVPGWKKDGRDGVPEWAKEDYKRESRETLISSMTPDKKIGSVYFGDDSRIRTTHSSGPEKEGKHGHSTVRFNIDEEVAISDFLKAFPKVKKNRIPWDAFDEWVATTLNGRTVDDTPGWAKLVDKPDTALDLSSGEAPPENLKLFEVFSSINGQLEGWHPSRGVAVKFETDKQTIGVLNKAIEHIGDVQDPGARNTKFFQFVQKNLPNFVKYIRSPDEVD